MSGWRCHVLCRLDAENVTMNGMMLAMRRQGMLPTAGRAGVMSVRKCCNAGSVSPIVITFICLALFAARLECGLRQYG